MPREAELSLNEREFILQALGENVRLDGRAFDAFRDLELAFGDEYGVADVRLGKTRILVRVSADVTAPFADRKFDGVFNISTEFSPMASPAFEVGRQTEAEVILSRILEKAIRRSGALDTESLCIVAGAKCFSVRADVNILDHDGNLIDASCIAIIAALQHFRRPDIAVEGEKVTVFSSREREPVPLSMLHHPLCVTFSYYNSGEIMLVDATAAEEQVREGEVIITMNKFGEICQIAKYGGTPVDPLAILQCNNVALSKVQTITKYIQSKLEEDNKKRDKGGLMAELSAENAR
ncbi:exosome complex component rrp45 [Diplodia corticola]|uniref:Exosome complex component RRP45 n=1 Tax=Diplodia corticola TaxID=236234 RepID=A0A1J9S6N7_9PEZI|nr:exosome complex component rrp45 [Diplodia corticola]OJD36183.1 exosome complex component rrp45 [Diplodia corticola]